MGVWHDECMKCGFACSLLKLYLTGMSVEACDINVVTTGIGLVRGDPCR